MAYFPDYDGTDRIVRFELCFTFYLILFNSCVCFFVHEISRRIDIHGPSLTAKVQAPHGKPTKIIAMKYTLKLCLSTKWLKKKKNTLIKFTFR